MSSPSTEAGDAGQGRERSGATSRQRGTGNRSCASRTPTTWRRDSGPNGCRITRHDHQYAGATGLDLEGSLDSINTTYRIDFYLPPSDAPAVMG
jgi:hypothetical protein